MRSIMSQFRPILPRSRSGTTEHEDLINGISPEIRDNINLNLDENLKAFVEQYAKEYLQEDISLGGMKR